ncbi:MAG: heavy metal transporter, partial [Acetobacteraceae bacterium]
MHCGGCAKGVRASLSEVAPGVTVEINLERR